LGEPKETPPVDYSEPQSYTPKYLADKILTSRSSIEGERKLVTVLFADVASYTSMAEKLDPEEVHQIMDGCFRIFMDEIHRYEGTINQFTGDGVMALFGAPVAHEDHAQRACRAALSIQNALRGYAEKLNKQHGVNFAMRIGLNSGPVVVGSIGDDLRMDYTAVGDTTNLAARMESTAKPGTVVVSRETHRLVRDFFELKFLGKVEIKGKEELQETYELVRAGEVSTRIEAAVAKGLTRFVGRKNSMTTLVEAYDKAQSGSGQVVGMVGEAGVGKSRLLLEFRNRLPQGEFTYLEGRCHHFGGLMAYLPILDILKSYFDIKEEDRESAIKKKMVEKVLQLDEKLQVVLPPFENLLSLKVADEAYLELDPKQKRGRVFEALRDLLIRESQNRPLVVAVEDLHWIDKTSKEFLDYLIGGLTSTRILLILLHRPEYTHPWGSKSYYSRIGLDQLGTESSAELVRAILEGAEVVPELRELVLSRTGGNPLFMEEFTHTLLENGSIHKKAHQYVLSRQASQIQVPGTIQGIIAARMDRLEDNLKRTMQVASVIGRDFAFRILQTISGMREELKSHLINLQGLELIYEKSLFPELAYIFKHALTHEVAYNSLLVRRRKELHRLIGQAIEDVYDDRLVEHYEVLAHHFSKGEEWAKALDYLIRAAQKAAKAFAAGEAVALYDQALDAAKHLGDAVEIRTVMTIHQAKAELHIILSDFGRARAEGENLLTLARKERDRVSEGSALAGIAAALYWSHDFDQALKYSREAIELAQRIDAKQILAAAHFTAGTTYAITGQLDQAASELDRSFTISQQVGDVLCQSQSLIFTGYLKNWEGDFAEALHLESEALRIAREHNLPIPLLRSLFGYGVVLTGKGNYDEALAAFEEGLALSEKLGDEFYGYRFLNCLGWLYSELGELNLAVDLNRRGAEGARERGDHEGIANAEINLGDVFLTKADLTIAREFLDEIHRLVKDPATTDWMKWRYSTRLFASLGELWLARDEHSRALEFAGRCLDQATRTNSRKYLVKGRRLMGEIAFARGQWGEAENELRQALIVAQEIGNPPQLWKTYAVLGDLLQAQGRRDDAGGAYSDALSVIKEVADGLKNERLKETLLRSPRVQDIRQKVKV
jgi:class 3 adenylate cyclase/tetratricopeptide (TPR) repeat protein